MLHSGHIATLVYGVFFLSRAGKGGDLDPASALQRQAQAGGVRAELDHIPHACNGMNARSHR